MTGAGKSYSTTSSGDLVLQNDLWSLANLARISGAKPLDEAISRDAIYRVQAYQSAKQKEINALGEAIKTTVVAGQVPSVEEVNSFAERYTHLGGDQKNFSKFMIRAQMSANTSVANKIADNVNNPFSQYMQKMMGGYDLRDFNNGLVN
jgi:predicted component of type VI protein secretion system